MCVYIVGEWQVTVTDNILCVWEWQSLVCSETPSHCFIHICDMMHIHMWSNDAFLMHSQASSYATPSPPPTQISNLHVGVYTISVYMYVCCVREHAHQIDSHLAHIHSACTCLTYSNMWHDSFKNRLWIFLLRINETPYPPPDLDTYL